MQANGSWVLSHRQLNRFTLRESQAHPRSVRKYLDNYRNVRDALNEICAINTELLRRREELD